jgi:hypothetical protein
MVSLRGLGLRLRAIVRRDTVERELDDELRFHIEQETVHLITAGVSPNEARRRARATLGGVENTKERYRDGRGDRLLHDVASDLRYALRLLSRHHTLSLTVITILTLGIGATVAIFSGRTLAATPGMDMIEPLYQETSAGIHLVVRSDLPPQALLRAMERGVVATDPLLAPTASRTMEDIRNGSLALERFMAVLLSVFAVAGALLAIVGVYGVVAESAQRRLPEMGIRMALGARVSDVRWLVVRAGLTLAFTGALVGVVGMVLLRGVFGTLLYRVSPLDPLAFGLVVGGLLVTGGVAAWVPARRMGDPSLLGRSLR